MELTEEQRHIVDCDKNIILVNAYAGTGKTSTLVQFCKARKNARFLYLAYNASMAKEAKSKFKGNNNVTCATIHSLAFRYLGKKLEKYKKRLGKESLNSVHLCKYFEKTDRPHYYANLLFSIFKKFLNSENSLEAMISKISSEYFGIASFLPILWHDILENEELPFEHDYYLKMFQLSQPEFTEFDYILVDEAQDLNPAMFDIILNQKCKKVFIGDTYQKIYGFRDCINALEILCELKNSAIFYLTKTFRCPQYIVEVANPYLYLLGAQKPLEGNFIPFSKGSLENGKKECIICRTNARVFDYVIENQNFKFHFIGGLDSYNFNDILDIALLHSKNKENRKYIKNKFYNNFADPKELKEHIKESGDVEAKTRLIIFYKYVKTINLFEAINAIKHYPISEADYIITSAHKSKGLEWDFVRIDDDFFNIKEAFSQAKEKGILPLSVSREELNLLYVALTRAKKHMEVSEDYILTSNEIIDIKQSIVMVD